MVFPTISMDELMLFSCHSICVKAAEELQTAGKDATYIKLCLRWLRYCFECYLRNTQRICAQHTAALIAFMIWLHMCDRFLYSSTRACITLREMQLRGSNLDPFVAEAKHCLLVLDPGRYLFQDWTDHGYCTFLDRQPPTLTAQVDRPLAVLHQNGQPVAQKMRTGLLYLQPLVLGKNIGFFVLT